MKWALSNPRSGGCAPTHSSGGSSNRSGKHLDEGGLTVSAELRFQDGERRTLGVRVAANEVGTYALRLQSGGEVFHGSAKLESAPNLGLLWNDSETVFLSFTLFPVQSGHGCRGFLRDGGTNYTWELAFSLKQDVVKGDNVVSLRGRGPRRI